VFSDEGKAVHRLEGIEKIGVKNRLQGTIFLKKNRDLVIKSLWKKIVSHTVH